MARRDQPEAGVLMRKGSGAVLMIANFASDVGFAWWLMENYWAIIAEEAQSRGRRAILAYPKIDAVPERIRRAPLELVEVDFGSREPGARALLLNLIRKHRVSGLYLTDQPYLSGRYGRLRQSGVSSIVMHDHTPGDRPALDGLRASVKRMFYHVKWTSCDWYVASTEHVQKRMITNACIPEDRILVMPNGVISRSHEEGERQWARREFGADDQRVVVGIVARAHPIKGIDFAVRCADSLRSRHPEVLFVFVGDGPFLEEYKREIASRGLEGHFICVGRRRDVRVLMAGMDIGFHPSMGEVGYCLSILEMMDASLPVVVPDLPSVSGATRDGETGRIYLSNSMDAACGALSALIVDRGERARLGSRARQIVRSQYSLEKTAKTFRREVAPLL